MALSRRTKMFMVAAGLAGAGTVAGAGAALAGTGPEPARTRLQIVEYRQGSPADAPGRDCPDGHGGSGRRGGPAVAEGTQ